MKITLINIEDAQSFSSIALIIPSRDFSVKILTKVLL